MHRREFLKYGMSGLAAIVAGRVLGVPGGFMQTAHAAEEPGAKVINIIAREALVEMVDLTQVYHWLFDMQEIGPRFPGPVIWATEGDTITINFTNALDGEHAFEIDGVPESNTGPVRRLRRARVTFTVPAAGTYIYHDPLNAPINRVMGLHGVFISVPAGDAPTPYSDPTAEVSALFADLGTHEVFPGHGWAPNRKGKVWVFHQIDPLLNARVRNGEVIAPDAFGRAFLPRYFTTNGRSGYFSAHERHETHLDDTVGNPHLIRNVNTGIWGHSPHIHANHVYLCAHNGQVQDNVFLLDTWTSKPMDRHDLLFPYIMPPDIPLATWQKVIAGTQEEPFPMDYPMHSHLEIDNTAAGGNYPQGNVTHVIFRGPVDTIAAPGNPPAGYPPEPNHNTPPIMEGAEQIDLTGGEHGHDH